VGGDLRLGMEWGGYGGEGRSWNNKHSVGTWRRVPWRFCTLEVVD